MKITYLLVILLVLVPIVLAQEVVCNTTQCDATCVKCTDGICHDPGYVCAPAAPVCTDSQCDPGCMKCSDGKCHETTFVCRERVSLTDLFPTEIDLGETELTVLLNNNGNVDLKNVRAEVKGDGITLLGAETIPKLNVDREDYATIKISAAKLGKITLLVKFFVNDVQLDEKQTEDITVKGVLVIQYNQTELENELAKSKQDYLDLEKEYQNKQAEGYLVDIVSNDMKDLDSAIKDARDALLEGDYKKADLNIKKAQGLSTDIKTQLDSAQKKQTSFTNQLKSYLIYAGSIAAALISIITAWKLTKTHVINKENLKGLHNRGKEGISALKNVIKKEEKEIKKGESIIKQEKNDIKKGKNIIKKEKKAIKKEEKKIPEEDSEEE